MEDLIDSEWPDIIVVEDLERICRRVDAIRICESCEDSDTRLIAINDHVDTADLNWKLWATIHPEKHQQDASARIKTSGLKECSPPNFELTYR